jgi:hypothetical protein
MTTVELKHARTGKVATSAIRWSADSRMKRMITLQRRLGPQ